MATPMDSWVSMLLCLVFACLLIRKYRNRNGRQRPPGPWGLPVIGHFHLLGDLPHHSLQILSKKYGPMMYIRLGFVPTIVVSSPEIAELVLKTHDLTFASRPTSQATQYLWYDQKDMALAKYGSRWRNLRKLCTTQLLNASKIESTKLIRKEEVESAVRSLVDAAEACAVVDLNDKVASLLQKVTLGMIIGPGTDERFDFKTSMDEVMRLTGVMNLADYIPLVSLLDVQGLSCQMKSVGKVVDGLLEDIISEHERDGNTGKARHMDFIDVMLSLVESNNKQEEKFDRTTIKALLLDMIAGTMESSATAIQWALAELLRHPRVMKKLQSEIEKVVGLDRMVEESDLDKLDYLDLVVKESMRLHPVGPFLSSHESMEDITIDGYFIPKKSRILVNVWAIMRDPLVWSSNANEFYPERFIGVNTDFRGNDFRFLPFGSGRRGCVGVQLGLTIVGLVLAQFVHCFDWDLPDGMTPADLDMSETFGLTVPIDTEDLSLQGSVRRLGPQHQPSKPMTHCTA